MPLFSQPDQCRLAAIKTKAKAHGVELEQIAAAVNGYSQTYLLKVLRNGIKSPSSRVLSVIEEALAEIVAANNQGVSDGREEPASYKESTTARITRKDVVEIIKYQDSDKWPADVDKFSAAGLSQFEAKVVAMLVHMNHSVL